MLREQSCCYPLQQAQNRLYFIIKCCNFAHHSSVHYFFFKLPLCFEEPWFPLSHFQQMRFEYLLWVFETPGWQSAYTWRSWTELQVYISTQGCIFLLFSIKALQCKVGFVVAVGCGFFFLFLTKLSVVLSIWGCCLLPFSSSNSENLGYRLLSLFTLKDFICFVGTHKSPVFPLFVLSIFFPQRRNRSSVKMFSGHLAALCT